MDYSSYCRCGQVQIKLSLPKPLPDYIPRLCDCDFCTKHQAAYLSDPDGVLNVTSRQTLEASKQGSEQAIFWQCQSCHSLILVSHEFDSGIKGALNVSLLATKYQLATSMPASPKLLSPQEKRERWQALWLKVNFLLQDSSQ